MQPDNARVLLLTPWAHMTATLMRLDAAGRLTPALGATLKHATASMPQMLRRWPLTDTTTPELSTLAAGITGRLKISKILPIYRLR
jgi:hypothetical protein